MIHETQESSDASRDRVESARKNTTGDIGRNRQTDADRKTAAGFSFAENSDNADEVDTRKHSVVH